MAYLGGIFKVGLTPNEVFCDLLDLPSNALEEGLSELSEEEFDEVQRDLEPIRIERPSDSVIVS